MIYDSLEVLPYKLFIKIEETQGYHLLNSNIKSRGDLSESKLQYLEDLWNDLYEEHLSKNRSSESKRFFKLSKTIDHLICLSKTIVTACTCLRFEYNTNLDDILKKNGFKLALDSTENYYASLDKIEREANNYVVKAEYYKNMLPEKTELPEGSEPQYTLDDVLASYSAILGFDIGDFNLISYNKYFAYQKQVESKINSIKNQNSNSNGKK